MKGDIAYFKAMADNFIDKQGWQQYGNLFVQMCKFAYMLIAHGEILLEWHWLVYMYETQWKQNDWLYEGITYHTHKFSLC